MQTNELDKIKTEHTDLSKSYNNQGREAFQYDAHGIIGKAARDLVELQTDDAPTKALNNLISSHYTALDLLDTLNGKAPHGGMFTRTMNRVGGEIAGAVAGSTIGHPVLGSIAGRFGSDMISNVMGSKLISNPVKRLIVQRLEQTEPEVAKAAKAYLESGVPDIKDIGGDSGVSGFVKKIKTEGQRGFVKNPIATTEKIHPDDLATMSDFTDYAAGSYSPSAEQAHALELDASRIWEHYFPNKKMPNTVQGVANEFGRVLEKNNFGKDTQPRDESGRFTAKGN